MSPKGVITMKISRGVSYQKVGDNIIIRNVNNLKEYRFDGSVEKILKYVEENPTHSVPTLLKFFASQCANYKSYKSCDACNKVQRDIGSVVDELLGEEIFTEIDDITHAAAC